VGPAPAGTSIKHSPICSRYVAAWLGFAVVRRVLIILLAMLACAAAWTGPASAQQSSDEHLVSELKGIRPEVPGLEMKVLERDRFLRLENKTDGTVVVIGYDDEPYLRLRGDGQVEVNTRSPSKYVNEDRFGKRPVPPQADSSASPRWQGVSSDGSYQWFDHRIHYMAPGVPEEVKDPAKTTKVFDWTVPLQVSGKPVRAVGTLNWQPDEDSGSSAAPLIAGGAGLAAIVAAAALLLRRRRRAPAPATAKPTKEAW
jgi:MYXO-CTERM domain-containing protein